jgi:hypothetical protein
MKRKNLSGGPTTCWRNPPRVSSDTTGMRLAGRGSVTARSRVKPWGLIGLPVLSETRAVFGELMPDKAEKALFSVTGNWPVSLYDSEPNSGAFGENRAVFAKIPCKQPVIRRRRVRI